MRPLFPILGTFLAGAALAGPPFFSIIDLGALGGRESRAYALNPAGAVCGEAATAEGAMHAFLWQPGGRMQDLGTLGGPTSRAYDLNAAGWVVGEAESARAIRQPFCWTAAGGMAALPLPDGAEGGVAHAVNDAGEIVGALDLAEGPCAAVWASPTNLPTLLTASGMAGLALALNRQGLVVGQSEMGEEEARVTRAFRRDPGGVVAGLTAMGEGLSSAAQAVNDAGQVAGSYEVRPGITHAFLFDGNGLHDLDDRNNVYSSAYGVNARGEVVGGFFTGPDDDDQAFLVTADGFFNLNDLLDTHDDWHVVEARGIHDDGRIVGCALAAGRERAVLLTPVNTPGGAPPTVRLTEPEAGVRFSPGASIPLAAEAASASGVKRVTFLANKAVVGSVTSPPYRMVWAHPPAGDLDLVARAVARDGLANESGRVRVRMALPDNAHPVVTWRAPEYGATAVTGKHLLVQANGIDADGKVVSMELWQDGTNLARSEGSVLGESWMAGEAGSYGLVAVAEDERGARATSEVLRIEVKAGTGEAQPEEK